MTVEGSIKKNDGNPRFRESNTIKVISQKTSSCEAIDDWKKMNALQFFTKFFK
jgi:hypothetical protein